MIQTFKRIGTIKAIQWTGDNFEYIEHGFICCLDDVEIVLDNQNHIIIAVINGKTKVARTGDWFYYSQRGNLKMITNDKLRRKYTTEEGD
jgi:hypothetical protein